MSPERGCLPQPSRFASSVQGYFGCQQANELDFQHSNAKIFSSQPKEACYCLKQLSCTLYICKQSVCCLCNTVLEVPRQDGGRKDVMFFQVTLAVTVSIASQLTGGSYCQPLNCSTSVTEYLFNLRVSTEYDWFVDRRQLLSLETLGTSVIVYQPIACASTVGLALFCYCDPSTISLQNAGMFSIFNENARYRSVALLVR